MRKTEKSIKTSTSDKKREKSESEKSEKLTSEKKDPSECETEKAKSSKHSTSISSGSGQNKSQSEKRSRSLSASKNSSSLPKVERNDSKKTDSTERRRSRKFSGSSAAISCQTQTSAEETNMNPKIVKTSVVPIKMEVSERQSKGNLNLNSISQKSNEVSEPEEKKIIFKFKLNPQQKQSLKDQASKEAGKDPLLKPTVDVGERLDAQFPKPEVKVLVSGPVVEEQHCLKPLYLDAIFVPPPMLSDLEDSDNEDESKHLPKVHKPLSSIMIC